MEFGVDVAIGIYRHFKGLQISFPVKLLSKEFVLKQIKKEYTGQNLKYLASKYEYSERWVRKLLDDEKEK